jgi:hypothetical protein
MEDSMRNDASLVPVTGKALPPAVAASAAQAKAEIEAAYTIAAQFRRDYDDVRTKVLATCKRPSFANDKSALYRRPVGGKQTVEGPGIRLAEELARNMGNIRTVATLVYEDADTQVYNISATDLETNASFGRTVTVSKSIERRDVRQGQEIVGQRATSQGEIVYIVRPTPEEVTTKANAAISKGFRNEVLRCIPQDIVSEAIETIKETRQKHVTDDPEKAKKDIADAFAGLNVQPSHLKQYLGCALGQASPAQLVDLRALYGAIRDGETTWKEVLEAQVGAEKSKREEGVLDLEDLEAPKDEAEKPKRRRGRPRKQKAAQPDAEVGEGAAPPDPDTSPIKDDEIPQEEEAPKPAEKPEVELTLVPKTQREWFEDLCQMYTTGDGCTVALDTTDKTHNTWGCDCGVFKRDAQCKHTEAARIDFHKRLAEQEATST